MTSKDSEIQQIYDNIKNYKSPPRNLYVCGSEECNKCKRCSEVIKMPYENSNLPTVNELENLIKKLTGIERNFSSNPMKWDKPFNATPTKSNISYSDYKYHILFIDYGIRLIMTPDMLKKIAILNRIVIEDTGIDKPLRLNYLDTSVNKVFKGPYLYITKLEPHSLIFNKPPTEYPININRSHDGVRVNFQEQYFKYNNLAEILLDNNWYT